MGKIRLMGGSIAVIFRNEQGKVICKDCWTNILPSYLGNIKLFGKDEKHIETMLNGYKDVPFAPISYGIVVIDFMKNQVLDCNDYCHPCFPTPTKFVLIANTLVDDNVKNHLQELVETKRVLGFGYYDKDGQLKEEKLEGLDLEGVIQAYKRIEKTGCFCIATNIDTSPFECITFRKCIEGFAAIKEELIQNGFQIDEKEWAKYIEGHFGED